jgi:hypothetical protein
LEWGLREWRPRNEGVVAPLLPAADREALNRVITARRGTSDAPNRYKIIPKCFILVRRSETPIASS